MRAVSSILRGPAPSAVCSAVVMMAWLTDPQRTRKTSLNFRFLVAMEGSLGIGANLNNFTPEDMATAKDPVTFYKTIRPTVQQGLQYRLIAPSRPGAPSERALFGREPGRHFSRDAGQGQGCDRRRFEANAGAR